MGKLPDKDRDLCMTRRLKPGWGMYVIQYSQIDKDSFDLTGRSLVLFMII
jgi:hypothetical protein